MNAGCYGSDTWEIVASVLVVTRAGEIKRRTPAEYEIGYRHVELRAAAPAELFAAAWFRLVRGDGGEGRRVIKELLQRRIDSQPLEQPNAGSVFRNPPGDYAARLIESWGGEGAQHRPDAGAGSVRGCEARCAGQTHAGCHAGTSS